MKLENATAPSLNNQGRLGRPHVETGNHTRDQLYLWLSGAFLLISLPARFAGLNSSLWMDEAWVANSLLEPSLRDMFFTKTWTPLFLLLGRWTISFAGSSDVAFRILPLAAGLTALVLVALALRRWLTMPAALLSLTLIASNYWVIKYPQQVKQYGTDLLVSALLLFLLGRFIEGGQSWRQFGAPLFVSAVGLFLSYTTMFWIPTLLLCAAIPRGSGIRWKRMAWAAGLLLSVLVVEYVVFIMPNRSFSLVDNWRASYLDPLHPLISMERLIFSIGTLLVAVQGPPAAISGLTTAALAIYASLRAARGALVAKHPDFVILAAGALPLGSVLTAGTLQLYPVLDYPRMLMFALPSLALLLGYGAEGILVSVFQRLSPTGQTIFRLSLYAACALVVLASQFVYFGQPRPTEENKPALLFIQSRLAPSDLLFVHPGMYEQFKYYRTALGFHPQQLYVGNVQWPCCATGDRQDSSSSVVKDLAGDLREAVLRSKGHRLWLFFPAATAGHWSAIFRHEIELTPAVLAGVGCAQEVHRLYGQTLVESYVCR
jgi:Dolichyl-phosphate-mannose-protein mannosyltransferase